MSTPEGKVKKLITAKIKEYPEAWYHMPVVNGFGKAALDYLGYVPCRGIAVGFVIEAKRPGKEPTARQNLLIEELREIGVKTFVIDGPAGVAELGRWLDKMRAENVSNTPTAGCTSV
jgi:hypothetical protein